MSEKPYLVAWVEGPKLDAYLNEQAEKGYRLVQVLPSGGGALYYAIMERVPEVKVKVPDISAGDFARALETDAGWLHLRDTIRREFKS